MTPLQIKMMLHYYCSPEPYSKGDGSHAHSSAVFEQRSNLMDKGLLRASDRSLGTYECTERGEVFVKAVCETPLPICKWMVPERGDA